MGGMRWSSNTGCWPMLCHARVQCPALLVVHPACSTLATAAMEQLPAPAVELIALHLARSSTVPKLGGSEPRRLVLPLVCRSWRRALQLTPGLWEEVGGQAGVAEPWTLSGFVLAALDAQHARSIPAGAGLHTRPVRCSPRRLPAAGCRSQRCSQLGGPTMRRYQPLVCSASRAG